MKVSFKTPNKTWQIISVSRVEVTADGTITCDTETPDGEVHERLEVRMDPRIELALHVERP